MIMGGDMLRLCYTQIWYANQLHALLGFYFLMLEGIYIAGV